VIILGSRAVRLYPIYHPAAALYTPRMLETLREDFSRLPELLSSGAPEQPPADLGEVPEVADSADLEVLSGAEQERQQGTAEADQLGLF
jgi:DNA polymerase